MSIEKNININLNKECRICFEPEDESSILISPCDCRGTSKYVHLKCLQNWRNLNKNREAYKKCMECRKNYLIRKKFRKEIFKINFKLRDIFFFVYFFSTGSTILISIYDINFYVLWIMNLGNPSKKFNFCSLSRNKTNFCEKISFRDMLENSFFLKIIFYQGFFLFIQVLLVYLFYIYKLKKKIKRKLLFFRLSKYINILTFIFAFLFPLLYNLLVNINNSPYLFIVFILLKTFFEFFYYYFFMKYHNSIIKKMNTDYNPETILSYEINPLFESSFEIERKEYDI